MLPLAAACEGFALLAFLLCARCESLLGHEDIADFSSDIKRFGIYDLPCGGGIITNPSGTSRWLARGYGRQGAETRCLSLLAKGPLASDEDKLIVGLGTSVLYSVGDEATIDRLQGLRNALLQTCSSPDATDQERSDAQARLRHAEALIAGLCHRHHLELPPGIQPLDQDRLRFWFD